MVELVLEKTQKLFGRGFLIAAFVPSLLFVLTAAVLAVGIEEINRALGEMVNNWKANLLKIAALLIVVYLLAYVLYGIRGLIYQVYQGDWLVVLPWKIFRWLEWLLNLPRRLGIASVTHSMRRSKALADEKVRALDLPAWIVNGFGNTFSMVKLSEKQALKRQNNAEKKLNKILGILSTDGNFDEHDYWNVLSSAHLLKANLRRFTPCLQQRVETLVARLSVAHNDKANAKLRESIQRLQAIAEREWMLAQGWFTGNFPKEEGWLRPTRLGTLAMVHELYPYDRYGVMLTYLWPRLVYVIPEDVRGRIEDTSTYLDFTLVMSLLSLLLAITAASGAFQVPSTTLGARLAVSGGFVFASWLFYRLARAKRRNFG